jgi:dCMP deaminase
MYQEAGVEYQSYDIEQINVDDAHITVAPGGFFKKVMNRLLLRD